MDFQKILKIYKISYYTSWHRIEMHKIYHTQPLSLTDSFEVAAADHTQMHYHVSQHDMYSAWIWGGSK